MPKSKQKNVSQTKERVPTAEDDTASQPDTGELQVDADMASLQTILRELREFRCENGEALREIREDIKTTNSRIDDAEMRISEADDRVQGLEETTRELLRLKVTPD